MPRKPGDKDRKPRAMSAASLANINPRLPDGFASAMFRLCASWEIVARFRGLTARERGNLITEALVK